MGAKTSKLDPAVTVTADERREIGVGGGQPCGAGDEELVAAARRAQVVEARNNTPQPSLKGGK